MAETPKTDTPKCEWPGKSGKKYAYWVYELPHEFLEQDGNYIFCKLNAQPSQFNPIYFGEGNLRERIGEGHHQWECVMGKGATHIHAHLNSDETARKQEETDLLANYPQAYSPTGCNEREGG